MDLSIDILSVIFEYLDTKELIWASRVCKQWRRVFIKYLPKYKLDLYQYIDKITDASLVHLKGIQTIDLSWCKQITDSGLVHLKDVHTINLYGCNQITDAGLVHLKDVHTINLNYCNKITNAGLVHLKGVHVINLHGCWKITDAGVEILINSNPTMKIRKQSPESYICDSTKVIPCEGLNL